jgi:hypothetical protein
MSNLNLEHTIVHLGSHGGNIGDNVSHEYVQGALSREGGFRFLNLEIREFYVNDRRKTFIRDFIPLVREMQGGLIGGGAYLAPLFAETASGTTLDFCDSDLVGLESPLVVNAVGMNTMRNVDPRAVEKLRTFLQGLSDSDRPVHIFLRSDGSEDSFKEMIGDPNDFRVGFVPDPGFGIHRHGELPSGLGLSVGDYVVINLAGDALSNRFASEAEVTALVKTMRDFIRIVDSRVVFIAHIAQDFGLIGQVLAGIDDWRSRSKVVVAPLVQSYGAADLALSVYRNSRGVIANRYHSVVLNIGEPVPFLAIVNSPNVAYTIRDFTADALRFPSTSGAEVVERMSDAQVQKIGVRTSHVEGIRRSLDSHMETITSIFKG